MSKPVSRMREWLHSRVQIDATSVVLDLGCGNGADIRSWYQSTPATFIGFDQSTTPADPAKVADVTLIKADVSEPLPLADTSVDLVYSVNTLECISDKQALLREVHRVLKPNGRVVFAHWDWDTQTFDGEHKPLIRNLIQAFADWKQPWMDEVDPWMGRRLNRVFAQSALFEGAVEVFTLVDTDFSPGEYGYEQAKSFGAMVKKGLIGAEDFERFWTEQTMLGEAGKFFFSLSMFAFVGTKTT